MSNSFGHGDIQFEHPPHWMDRSRLMLIHPSNGSNIQIGKMRPTTSSVKDLVSAYCSRVVDDLKPVNGRLVENQEFKHPQYPARTISFEFKDQEHQAWQQLHHVVVAGPEAFTFVWTVRQANFSENRSEIDTMVKSFVLASAN